jgi:hypothetical protein
MRGAIYRRSLFEIFALCDLLRLEISAAQVDRIGRKTCLPRMKSYSPDSHGIIA